MAEKRGRPKLPEGEAKAEVLTLRLSPDEMKAVEASAAHAGKSVSEWARGRLLGNTASSWQCGGEFRVDVYHDEPKHWEAIERYAKAMQKEPTNG